MRMTGGQALVRSLIQYGVDTIFAIPGVQLDHLFNAFYDERNRVRVIQTRHEQGTAYMAFGYAQSTGRVGTCAVVPGPGLLNATGALSTAYACNAQVLCVSGQIPSTAIGRGFGMLHEIPDQLGMLRSVTKWAARIGHPQLAPEIVREAFRQLRTGRPRPVEVEMAMDILAQAADVDLLDPVAGYDRPSPDPDGIEAAAKLLGNAAHPLIVVGGGILEAGAELAALAEMLEAPVMLGRHTLGVIPSRHRLVVNPPTAHRLWADADVVLAIGTRLNPQVPTWGVDADLKIVRIDIDPEEITRAGRPTVGILSDAKKAVAALVDAVPRHNRKRAGRDDEIAAARAKADAAAATLAPQRAFVDAIRAELPEDGIFVEELTQVGYCARFMWTAAKPRKYISTGYQGTLGFGFATAIGVKVGNPDVPVVSISGDGGFMYNVGELATAVQQKVGLVTIVFNDNAYGNVRRMQQVDHGGKVLASDLHNPDFVKMAESFGAQGLRADGPDSLRAALRRGFDTPGPTLIEVPMPVMPDPWHMLQLPAARPKKA